jgi:hypothetical protein
MVFVSIVGLRRTATDLLLLIRLEPVEHRVDQKERDRSDDGRRDIVANVGVSVTMEKDVGMKIQIPVDLERSRLDEREGGIVLSNDVRREVE